MFQVYPRHLNMHGISSNHKADSHSYLLIKISLYHFDVYRIEDEEEMYEVGFDEYLYGDGVCLIEWADLIKGLIPKEHTRIEIKKNLEKGFDYRSISVQKF